MKHLGELCISTTRNSYCIARKCVIRNRWKDKERRILTETLSLTAAYRKQSKGDSVLHSGVRKLFSADVTYMSVATLAQPYAGDS